MHPLRILFAEDDPVPAKALIALLTEDGRVIERAADGAVGWDRMSSEPSLFDVLITDHQMPRVDGLTLVARLRAVNFTGRVVVHAVPLTAEDTTRRRLLRVDAIYADLAAFEPLLKWTERLNRGCGRETTAVIDQP